MSAEPVSQAGDEFCDPIAIVTVVYGRALEEGRKIGAREERERAKRLLATLDEIDEFLEDQLDVRDGPDGPLPNKAMSLLAELRAAIAAYKAGKALRSPSQDWVDSIKGKS